MRTLALLFLLTLTLETLAQVEVDTTFILDEVEIQGYLYQRPLSESAVSVGTIDQSALDRFNNTSVLPAFNVIPGVKMEERSPGSNRLAIRGSSLRSPFGVRNVKIYWNNLPVTDAGGNTYLNAFDFSSVNAVEVIKGPGGSLYGAGTGGVVLLRSQPRPRSGVEASVVGGSFGLRRFALRGDLSEEKVHATMNLVSHDADGYRDQTAASRRLISGDVAYDLSSSTSLSASYFITNISYETPGGLTRQQFDADPKQSRPAAGALPGAKEQQARVNNEMIFVGLTADHEWNENLSSRLSIYGSTNDFENYAIANYELRDERNFGGRLENTWSHQTTIGRLRISAGGEFQKMTSPIDVSENNGGAIGPLMVEDDLTTTQSVAFAQAQLDLPKDFFFTAGLSASWSEFSFVRVQPEEEKANASFSGIWSPRVALLKKFGAYSLYTSVSKGFSPPTLAEVRPSTNTFNADLEPETGLNYELGVRKVSSKFEADLTLYHFGLRNAIVLRRNDAGQEYFLNAGGTTQRGVELSTAWTPRKNMKVWSTWAYSHYRFKDFIRYDQYVEREVDYSGNKVTGVPPLAATAGLDWQTKSGIYNHLVLSYNADVPLNDLNDEFADKYFLVNIRIGYRKTINEKLKIDLFAAVDNALDEEYSLGNDLNAARRRFYNAAPTRNYSVGLNVKVF